MITPIINCRTNYNKNISFAAKERNNQIKNLALSSVIATGIGLGGIADAEQEHYDYREYLIRTYIKPEDDIFERSTLTERIDLLKMNYNIWVLHKNLDNIEGYIDPNSAARIIRITSKNGISISFDLDVNSSVDTPVIIRMQGSKDRTAPDCIFEGLSEATIVGSKNADTIRLIDCKNVTYCANGGNDEVSARNLNNSQIEYVRKAELVNSHENTILGEKYGLSAYLENCNNNNILGQRSLSSVYIYNGNANLIVFKRGNNRVGLGGESHDNIIIAGHGKDEIHLSDGYIPNIKFKFPLSTIRPLDGNASNNLINTQNGEDHIIQGNNARNNKIVSQPLKVN